MKTCNECHQDKPLEAFAPQRGVCKRCRNRLDVERRQAQREQKPKPPEDFDSLPVHEYTDIDRAWMAAALPADRSRPLFGRVA